MRSTERGGLSLGALGLIGIALLLGIAIGAIIWTNDDTASPSEATASVDELTEQSLRLVFGDNINTKQAARLFTQVDTASAGPVTASGLDLERIYVGLFEITDDDLEQLANSIPQADQLFSGLYAFIMFASATPPNDESAVYEFGIGLSEPDRDLVTLDPLSEEPLASNPQNWLMFAEPTGSWEAAFILDSINNFQPASVPALMFYSPESNVGAALVPQRLVGEPGQDTDLTLQLFAQPLFEDEAAFDQSQFGVSGQHWQNVTLPGVLPSPIFVDGFESGDISNWSAASF